jgi:hypothetical protein
MVCRGLYEGQDGAADRLGQSWPGVDDGGQVGVHVVSDIRMALAGSALGSAPRTERGGRWRVLT